MRLPRVRFTVRLMMVALAVVTVAALSQWGEFLRRRSQEYARRSVEYRAIAAKHARLAESELKTRGQFAVPGGGYGCVEWTTPRGEYHRRMSQKYDQAAARPWLAVAPDPPPPE